MLITIVVSESIFFDEHLVAPWNLPADSDFSSLNNFKRSISIDFSKFSIVEV